MVICLCGNEKLIIINQLKRIYKEKIIIYDYNHATFRTIVETESVKYKLQEECKSLKDTRKLYGEYVTNIVNNKTHEFIENNKDKIIVLISDNILLKDLDKTEFFDKSDLKILLKKDDNTGYKYDESKFDLVIKKSENFDIKKLVKL